MAEKIIHIIGDHNMVSPISHKYCEMGENPLVYKSTKEHSGSDIPDEMVIATSIQNGRSPMSEDLCNVGYISSILKDYKSEKVIRIHLLTHSSDIMSMMQTWDLDNNLQGKAEIYPFSYESLWASIITGASLSEKLPFPTLDRERIGYASDKRVHLVILGMNSMSQEIAKYTSLVCHFPNYTRDHSLRTRITIIDSHIETKMGDFISKHESLFNNSYYRYIDLNTEGSDMVKFLHRPQYHNTREDFVDIEWEFVKSDIDSTILREKLNLWASSDRQILTLVLCYEDDEANIASALKLPQEIATHETPVLIRTSNAAMLQMLCSKKIPGLVPFGMKDYSFDVDMPLITMAKSINYVYDCCYNDNYTTESSAKDILVPISINQQKAEESWKMLSNAKRWSNIYHAMTVGYKMRSLGYTIQDWNTLYSLSAQEIANLAEVEHNRWSVEELFLGYRPANDSEQKTIENDISQKKIFRDKFVHFDLRAYKDLRIDHTGKNVNTYDICISAALPLIVSTFKKGGQL